jgi:hypothetical protein
VGLPFSLLYNVFVLAPQDVTGTVLYAFGNVVRCEWRANCFSPFEVHEVLGTQEFIHDGNLLFSVLDLVIFVSGEVCFIDVPCKCVLTWWMDSFLKVLIPFTRLPLMTNHLP